MKSQEGRRIHFAVMAIESAAKKLGISNQEMYKRLKAQNLVSGRLIKWYETLHTQSLAWVTDDIIEALKNREEGR